MIGRRHSVAAALRGARMPAGDEGEEGEHRVRREKEVAEKLPKKEGNFKTCVGFDPFVAHAVNNNNTTDAVLWETVHACLRMTVIH